jgi:large subunit ribosomal protein L23
MGLFTNKNQETKDDSTKTSKSGDVQKSAKKSVKKSSMKDLYADGGATGKKTSSSKKPAERKVASNASKTLVKPLITEKAATFSSQDKYVFEVSTSSNKIEIAKAIKEVYGVKPLAVNIINMEGKLKRQGRKYGTRKDWKKAVVTLPKGKTINIYEGV